MLQEGMYIYYSGGKFHDLPCDSVQWLKTNHPYLLKNIIEFPRGKQVVLEGIVGENGETLKFELKWFEAYKIRNSWMSKEEFEKVKKNISKIVVTLIEKKEEGFFHSKQEVNWCKAIRLTENTIQLFTKHTGYLYNCIIY